MATISVIIPIYNAEKYLSACIESVLNQTYSDFELLLINDGSTDESANIINYYENIDPRIHVFTQVNSGPSKARNTGIRNARGKYIAFIDSDDFVQKTYLQEAYSLINDSGYDLIIGSWKAIYSNYEEINGIKIGESKLLTGSDIYDLIYVLLSENKICSDYSLLNVSIAGPVAKLYLKLIVDKMQMHFPENLNYAEDVLFNLQYLFLCSKVYITDKVWYISNRNCSSISSMRSNVLSEIEEYICTCNVILKNQHISKDKLILINKASSYRYFMRGIEYIRNMMKNDTILSKKLIISFLESNIWFKESLLLMKEQYLSRFQILLMRNFVREKYYIVICLLKLLNIKRRFSRYKLKN